MARPDKAAAVERLSARFAGSNAAVLTEYRGLTVKDLRDLRRSLGDDATYAVAKNTLTKIAARQAGVEGLDDRLSGPTAIAFITGDVAAVAKGLRDFARDNPLLVIKGGVMDGRILDADTVRRLADLESREALLAKLAGDMKASMGGAAALFAAPLAQVARTLGALQDKAAQDPSAIGGAGAPAADQERSTAEDPAPEAADAAEATADAADAASNE
ncbi:50S ribosomal protein L10 [uncultured Propionibacterium sp.]|uniref:50S ribosomal protein L10 n=1 Tax=uncultured Propionibacterium sp. TaxID=218066 RepID=UPI00292F6425|nr:50S ribosomal protein L10 [uncultured Propionibacterium sp.]